MKRVVRIILIVISLILSLGAIFGFVDYSRIEEDKAPIFTIHIGKNMTGDSDVFYGLGYSVIKCPKSKIGVEEYPNKYEMGFLLDNKKNSNCYSIYYVNVEKQAQ